MTQKKNASAPNSGATPMDYLALALQQREAEPREHIRFLKRNSGKYFRDPAFWHSPLPAIHLAAVLDSDIQAEFLTELFAHPAHADPTFLEYIAAENPALFQKYFKLNYTHRIPVFRSALQGISQKVKSIIAFAQEIDWIHKWETKLDAAREQRLTYFLQFPPDQVIMTFLFLQQEMKVSPAVRNNRNERVREEVAMFQALNRILLAFAKTQGNQVKGSHYVNQKQIDRDWFCFAPKRMHEPTPESAVPLTAGYQILLRLVREEHDSSYSYSTIHRYLADFGKLKMLPHGIPELIENEANRRFEYDNRKATYQDFYFLNKSGFIKKQMEMMAKGRGNDIFAVTDHTMAMHLMNGEKPTLVQNSKTIHFDKCYRLLQTFGRFKGPEQRTYIGSGKDLQKTIMNAGSDHFVKELGPNEYLSIYDAPTFPEKIAKVFGWSVEESGVIVDFLTWDLAAPNAPDHWIHRPFLKIGPKIYWVGALLAERNWVFGQHLRMRSKEFPPQFSNELSAAFEQRIADTFRKAGFAVAQGVKFTSVAGASGDMDVVAYKDRCLFIVEAKNALVMEGFVENTYVETIRFEAKAAYQLDKCLNFARPQNLGPEVDPQEMLGENPKPISPNASEEISQETPLAFLLKQIGIDPTQIEDLQAIKIYPLIVSRAFEGDQINFRSHEKISFLELEIILTNGLKHLYGNELFDHKMYHGFYNKENPHFEQGQKPTKSPNRDLWQGQNSPTPDTIIQCIEQQLAWKEYHETWNY